MLLVASHPALDQHRPGVGHPEHCGRLTAAEAGLRGLGADAETEWLAPRWASREELSLVHDPGYLDGLAGMSAAGGGQLDPDTALSAGSWETARLTAGGGLAAIEALAGGRGDAAWVLGRPPGHHAGKDNGTGFCLLNNVAVAAASIAASGERVAIVDWDVHHGNGTQAIFWEEPRVLYVSVDQWPLYPGTGRVEDRGGAAALGTIVNLPLPPGATGDVYLELFDRVIAPSVAGFDPGWILVSAGFDAHRSDPLGAMNLTSGDFCDLTGRLLEMSAGRGRLAFFLEGGYDPEAIEASVRACASRLVGEPVHPEPPSSGGTGAEKVAAYRSLFCQETTLL